MTIVLLSPDAHVCTYSISASYAACTYICEIFNNCR